LLQCFEVTNLHSRLGIQLISCQSHQLCGFYVCPRGDDLTLGQSALLGCT
jgi:hypothetical protein